MQPEQLDAPSLMDQANRYLANHELDQACRLFEQICQADSRQLDAWLQLAKTQYQLERYPACLQSVSRVLRLDAANTTGLLVAAAALLELGQFDQVVRISDQLLALDPTHMAALLNKCGALLRMNRNEEALAMADRALAIDARQLTALMNRGLALVGLGLQESALQVFDQVLALRPGYANALINRSSILHALGRYEEALQAADECLESLPDAPTALLNRAAALLGLQRPADALEPLDRVLLANPGHFNALLNKSKALQALQRFGEALQLAEAALANRPDDFLGLQQQIQLLSAMERYADALTLIQSIPAPLRHDRAIRLAEAGALAGLGRHELALRVVEAVLRENPSQIDAIVAKTEILLWSQQTQVALDWIEQGLAAHPDDSQLLLSQALILLVLRHYRRALLVVERVLATDGQNFKALMAKASALVSLGRFQEALAISQAMLVRQVVEWQIYANLGSALAGLQRYQEAERAFSAAKRLNAGALKKYFLYDNPFHIRPTDAVEANIDPKALRVQLEVERMASVDWADYQTRVDAIRELVESALCEGGHTPLSPFHSLTLPLPASLQLEIARREADRISAGLAEIKRRQSFVFPSEKADRIKIGYVSADFRNHPTAHLMRSLFAAHDRRHFEIYGYSLRKDDGSGYYSQIKADCDHFVDLTDFSNAQAAHRIHQDGIHILVDLMAYTRYARPEIFALRPAAIQVNYLGFPGTTGADYLHYILVDPSVLPPAEARFFSEQPVYLPGSYQVNDRWQAIAETGINRADQGLPDEGFVFCCFNQAYKLDPVMFAVWMRLLGRVPDSVLWLYSNDDEIKDRLRQEAENRGIHGGRLIFARHLPKDRHLERYRLADLFLDTRIYGAHTTASDALWAGLPVLSYRGPTFAGRVGASLLQAIGLPELITDSLEGYEQRAVHLANHPEELAGLRDKLWQNRLTEPLFDTEGFVKNLERAYLAMWDRHRRGERPEAIWLSSLGDAETAGEPSQRSRRFWPWGGRCRH